jgi:hypothetical protein
MSASTILTCLISLLLVLGLASCGDKGITQEISDGTGEKIEIAPQNQVISEVSPPELIQELGSFLEEYQPQVAIASPEIDQLIPDNTVKVRFQVKDLPVYKNTHLNLGPHLQVILDNEPVITIYDVNQPLELTDLSPGTHSLRVFAVTPWDESFKNEGAYAQTTFHILTKTDDNSPDPALPLLTYNIPQGSYGAEPILLDFYLTNAPLHFIAQQDPADQIADWRIRCTINGESFVLDRWQSIYLKGFKPGKNWVRIEYLDEKGEPIKNVFNSTTRIINYEPKGKDALSNIIRGELKLADVLGIVDPNYTAPQAPAPSPSPTPETTPEPQLEEKQPAPEVEPEKPVETLEAAPIQPEAVETPAEEPTATPQPEAVETPAEEPTATPQPEVAPSPVQRLRGFFNQRQAPVIAPTVPEAVETPAEETTTTPQPEAVETPAEEPTTTPQPEAVETPAEEPTTTPQPEAVETPAEEPTTTPQPEVAPTPEAVETPAEEPKTTTQAEVKQPTIERLRKYFKRPATEMKTPAPEAGENPSPSEQVIEKTEEENSATSDAVESNNS